MNCLHPTCERPATMCGVACQGHWHGIPASTPDPKRAILDTWSAINRGDLDRGEGLARIVQIMAEVIVPWWTSNADRWAAKRARARAVSA